MFEKNKEYLLPFDKFQSQSSQRKLFLEFFNNQVSKEPIFRKKDMCLAKKFCLCDIFKIKILSLLNINFVPFVATSPKIINYKNITFFEQKIQALLNLENMPKVNTFGQIPNVDMALKLVKIIGGIKLVFKLNLQTSFEQFVLNKLLKDKKNRIIQQHENSINIIPSGANKIKVIPYWNMLNSNNQLINKHIENAIECIKNSSYKNIYLVYPKSDTFNKHMNVKVPELESLKSCEYGIKLIPYSLRSILK